MSELLTKNNLVPTLRILSGNETYDSLAKKTESTLNNEGIYKLCRRYMNPGMPPVTRIKDYKFRSRTLADTINAISGFVGSPGNQTLRIDDTGIAGTTRATMKTLSENVFKSVRKSLRQALLYGRSIILAIPPSGTEQNPIIFIRT